jgi:hydroxymethylpyrimidine kinase/phosphomethylpyrimidine kinase/thiamine-phosphate diphosphorylase
MTIAHADLWILAGIDPSNGAGLSCDIRVTQMLGAYACGVPTANTAQDHEHCQTITAVTPELFSRQLQQLKSSLPPKVIKVGMMPHPEHLRLVGDLAGELQVPVVVDPVLSTSSGYHVTPEAWREACQVSLGMHTTLLTPNLAEAEALSGLTIQNEDQALVAASRLMQWGCQAVLIKGGHRAGEFADDLLVHETGHLWLRSRRQPYTYRGTGCFLATAIAVGLSRGMPLTDACVYGRSHLNAAMESAWVVGDHRILNPQAGFTKLPLILEATTSWYPTTPFPTLDHENMGLYPIVDRAAWLKRLLPLGVRTIQLRIKDLTGAALEQEIDEAIELAKRWGCQLFINDYWQLAIEKGAFGIHLGQEDLVKADLKAIHDSGLRLGLSTHSYEELARALTWQPSYVALGPIFETTCKSMRFGPQGFDRIGEWVDLCPMPVVAIGGLKPEHAKSVMARGAQGLALISDITQAPNPEGQTKTWLTLLEH